MQFCHDENLLMHVCWHGGGRVCTHDYVHSSQPSILRCSGRTKAAQADVHVHYGSARLRLAKEY